MTGLAARLFARRVQPTPEPGAPEWERIASEITVIRRQQRGPAEPPDRIVFGPYRKACAEDLDYGHRGDE